MDNTSDLDNIAAVRRIPRGIAPTTSDIGRKVIYRTAPAYEAEEGVITSFNDHNVFVRYGSNTQSQATSRGDLDWVTDARPVGEITTKIVDELQQERS